MSNERSIKVKSKILLGMIGMSVLLMMLSQPALAYVYPDPPKHNTPGFYFSPWIVVVAVAVTVAIIGLVYVIRSRRAK
jgi:hypothetical protein